MSFVAGHDPQDPQADQPGHTPGIRKLPAAHVPEYAALVVGTDGRKMSKSAGNTIELFATDADVLLALLAPPGEFAKLDSWKAGGKGYADYKKALLEHCHATSIRRGGHAKNCAGIQLFG